MNRMIVAMCAVLGAGLACGGGGDAAPTVAATAAKGRGAALSGAQRKEAAKVAAAKKKNGTPSADGSKKLQVQRKKQKSDAGFVWVIVEEWVEVEAWHDEIWVVDAFVDADDVLVVELVSFDDSADFALLDELEDLSADAMDEWLEVAPDDEPGEEPGEEPDDQPDDEPPPHDDEEG